MHNVNSCSAGMRHEWQYLCFKPYRAFDIKVVDSIATFFSESPLYSIIIVHSFHEESKGIMVHLCKHSSYVS